MIPTGPYAGKVLMDWASVGPSATEGWIFVPESPGQLFRVAQTLPDLSLGCSGGSWDVNGLLVVAGGLAAHGEGVAKTYRFDPFQLKAPTYPVEGAIAGGAPWTRLSSDLSIKRYYPTLITLAKGTLSSTCGDSTLLVQGGSTVVLSGPPNVPYFRGNEFWQFLPPGGQNWSATLRPDLNQVPAYPNPNSLPQGTPVHNYVRRPVIDPANPLLDSYSRARQLGERNAVDLPLVKGRIFLANDVETKENLANPNVPNAPGISLVMKPPWPNDTACWELGKGPTATAGGTDPNVPNDHYYDPVVVLHTRAIKNRVLRFGGSRRPVAGEVDPCFIQGPPCSDESTWWPVDNDVEEFVPDYTNLQDPIGGGRWESKAPMCSPRVFHTATVLPTGQIFIEGGTAVDKWHSPCRPCYPCDALGNPGPNDDRYRPCGVAVPEIYDPSPLQSFGSGSSCRAAMASIPASPPGSPAYFGPTPRGYHHFAVLLTDGSVFIAGGNENHPNYPASIGRGDVYYPPYFSYGTQPSIISYPTAIPFNGSTFEIKATVFHRRIDRVVLTRPAAITHHFDNDQLYIELEFNAPNYSPNPAGQPVVLTATPPHQSLGPPGWYLLWVVEEFEAASGSNPAKLIPSPARFVKLE